MTQSQEIDEIGECDLVANLVIYTVQNKPKCQVDSHLKD